MNIFKTRAESASKTDTCTTFSINCNTTTSPRHGRMLKRNKIQKKSHQSKTKPTQFLKNLKLCQQNIKLLEIFVRVFGIACICIISAILPVKGKGTWQTSSITGFENKTLWAEFHANRKLLSLDLIKRASLHWHNQATQRQRSFHVCFRAFCSEEHYSLPWKNAPKALCNFWQGYRVTSVSGTNKWHQFCTVLCT